MSSTDHTLGELVAAYARSGDRESLDRIHSAVRRAPGFRVDLDVAGESAALHRRGAHAEIVVSVQRQMPAAFFSPAAHSVLAMAFDALDERTSADRERRLAGLALASLLQSGDGTADRPWRVVRLSDEYDVLQSQGRRSVRVDLVVRRGRSLDRHRCDDGGEAWFDLGEEVS